MASDNRRDIDGQPALVIRQLGLREYAGIYRAMQEHTAQRAADAVDEIWCLEHTPSFTLGLSGKTEHLLDPGAIPVYHTDRGGQATYHGPGQLVVYLLLDLKRLRLSVKPFVRLLEQSVIDFLAECGLTGQRRPDAPGVYLEGRKLAALGVRIKRGYSYHGLALNVNMALAPYRRINPCGYPELEVTRLADWGINLTPAQTRKQYLPHLLNLIPCGAIQWYDDTDKDESDIINEHNRGHSK